MAKGIICGLFFVTLLLTVSACENAGQGTGILKGTISIGPICPVETDPPDPGCLPTSETYKAYPVYIYTSDGSKKIKLISPESDGSFSLELAVDSYLIILEKVNSGIGSSNLPMEVAIKHSETTTINIDIDTGIR